MRAVSRLASLSLFVLVLVLASCGTPAAPPAATATRVPAATSPALISVRFAGLLSASQAYMPVLMMEKGIDKKYGLEIQLVGLSSSGAGEQFNSLRSGDADMSAANYLEVLRQRQAGLKVRAIRAMTTFSNAVVSQPGKPYSKLADLKGARVGTNSVTQLDWMILRAAGKKAYNFDISTDAQVTESAPPLLNQLIDRGQLDAALVFNPDFVLQPVSDGKLKIVTTVPKVMEDAGFDTQTFYLVYFLADSWRDKYPDGTARLVAAMDEAADLMAKDDSVWPGLAKRSGVTDPNLLPKFVEAQRATFKTAYGRDKLQPTQVLLDELVKIVGQDVLRVTKIDPDAFDFDSAEAAKKLRR
jgi:NitT/TauT family transport system substrate-binding protein